MKLSLRSASLVLMCLILIGSLGKPRVSAALEAGDKAPDFKLPGTTGVDISLSDFKSKKFVLLEFYAAAFVPT